MDDLVVRAESLHRLAGLLRAGLPLNTALDLWPRDLPSSQRQQIEGILRRTRLGQTPAEAVCSLAEWDDDALALSALFAVHSEIGGDLAEMLDALATTIEERSAWGEEARASVTGARVSSRLVAGLPLAFLPLTPASGAPLFDAAGLSLLTLGASLVAAGMAWIARLMPHPPKSEDVAVLVAGIVAASAKGGAAPARALEVIAHKVRRPELERARRLVVLGFTWSEALDRSGDEGLRSLGAALETTASLGLPVVASVTQFARRRREELARSFRAETRRASVLMVIPLTVCVLPAFVLLALGPFLRGLSLG